MAISSTSSEVIAETVRQILSARGPMSEDDLLDVLDRDGIDLGADPDVVLADVLDHGMELFMPLADGRWAWVPGLLSERIFTHRLSATEVTYDIIGLGTDLAPLTMLAHSDTYQRLTDGSPITEVCYPHLDSHVLAARNVPTTVVTGDGVLLLPPGKFAALGAAAGDLIGLRVNANGLELTAIAEPPPCDLGAALAGLLEQRPNRPEMLDVAVWTVCASNDNAFREPVAPLNDLLLASGLTCEGGWIAHSGFDFGSLRVTGRIETIKDRHQLDHQEAAAVLATVRLYEQILDAVYTARATHGSDDEHELISMVAQLAPQLDPAPSTDRQEPDNHPTVRTTLEFLADPAVAAAVLAETSLEHDHSAIGWGVFTESAEPWAPSVARPALRWLRAKAYERLGDIEQAEATLHAAEALDPSWPLTLMSLARYASDRGDAERGLALLRRAGVAADHDLVVLLEHFRSASGRLPLDQRAAWLYQKAGMNLLEGPFGPLLVETAQVRARYWDMPGALGRALQDGLASDVVLFEGGAFAYFLTTRGGLLPADERLLAQQWLLVQRSVYEVLAVPPSHGFTLRNMHTGDICEVRERVDSTHMTVGQLYCARVVPAGDTMQIFGRIEPVSRSERDDLITLLDNDPDPIELVAALSHRFAVPALHVTEGTL